LEGKHIQIFIKSHFRTYFGLHDIIMESHIFKTSIFSLKLETRVPQFSLSFFFHCFSVFRVIHFYSMIQKQNTTILHS